MTSRVFHLFRETITESPSTRAEANRVSRVLSPPAHLRTRQLKADVANYHQQHICARQLKGCHRALPPQHICARGNSKIIVACYHDLPVPSGEQDNVPLYNLRPHADPFLTASLKPIGLFGRSIARAIFGLYERQPTFQYLPPSFNPSYFMGIHHLPALVAFLTPIGHHGRTPTVRSKGGFNFSYRLNF